MKSLVYGSNFSQVEFIFSRVIVLLLISLVPCSLGSGHSVHGQGTPSEHYRILIDASKDGGSWWFPQAGTFDAQQPHQGKAFADLLRRDGAMVAELPRGAEITAEKLKAFDLVIRVPAFFNYSPSETDAYREIVAGGARVLIIGGSTRNCDRVANIFGLDFEKRTHFDSVKRWLKHPLTENIENGGEQVWSGILKAPNVAVLLGWLSRAEETPVLGYLAYGKGIVVFSGQALSNARVDRSFSIDLVNSILSLSPDDFKNVHAAEMANAETPDGAGPHLIEPQQNSTLSQPGAGEWRFDWEDIPDAENYEIVILGPSASIPFVRAVTDKSEFSVGRHNPQSVGDDHNRGYIADHNLRGWSWKVRAKISNGTWGAWSREQRFNVGARSN